MTESSRSWFEIARLALSVAGVIVTAWAVIAYAEGLSPGLVFLIALFGAPFVFYARMVKRPLWSIVLGIAMVAVTLMVGIDVVSSSSSTRGLGFVTSMLFDYAVVGAYWAAEVIIRHWS